MYSYKNTFVYLHIQKFRPAKTIKNGAISKSHKSREIKKQNKMEKVKMLLCGLVLFSTTTFVGCKKESFSEAFLDKIESLKKISFLLNEMRIEYKGAKYIL